MPVLLVAELEAHRVEGEVLSVGRSGLAPEKEASPSVLGEFVWTGFNYLGEPTPYFNDAAVQKTDWPARSSYFGIVDLADFPKDRYYLYQSVWTTEPMVHVLPHWNWAGREGQPVPVVAYTNADEVELLLNGRSLGRKQRGAETVMLPVGKKVSDDLRFPSRYRIVWPVPYEPGTIRADGDDLSFITVRVEDKDGNLCPGANDLVRFKVEGAGRIAAVNNGNAATVESFQADHRRAFNGLALVVVRSKRGETGPARIVASAEGLQAAETMVTASPP